MGLEEKSDKLVSVEERRVVEEAVADSVEESEISEVFVEVKDVASKEETVEEIGARVAKKKNKQGPTGAFSGVPTHMRLN